MDLQANPKLVIGEEFCFPATTTYCPTPYAPTEHQTIWGCGDHGLLYSGQQAEGKSCMYYVVPGYGIAHSPHGPYPLDPCAIADGRFVRAQEYLANTADSTYHQPVSTSPYAFLPSAADWAPASTSQTPAYTDGLFIPSGQGQTVPVASNKGVTWNPSLQSTTIYSKKFQDHAMLPKLRVQPGPKPRSYVNSSSPRLGSLSWQNLGKAKRPIGSMSSEVVMKSYTSRLHIGNPDGKIIIKTDQYNRDDFQVVYPNVKFFVIKPFDEEDVHKSIKYGARLISITGNQKLDTTFYGARLSSITGNEKLDTAFRDAKAIAASSSTLCLVFLFFSVS